MDSHKDAYFVIGDTIQVGKSASIPEATVVSIVEVDGSLYYRLSWSNGTVNKELVDEMDKKAVNKTAKF